MMEKIDFYKAFGEAKFAFGGLAKFTTSPGASKMTFGSKGVIIEKK